MQMIEGHRNHRASKPINPKFHFTGDMVVSGEIKLQYLSTKLMLADVLTKPLDIHQHLFLAGRILNCTFEMWNLRWRGCVQFIESKDKWLAIFRLFISSVVELDLSIRFIYKKMYG